MTRIPFYKAHGTGNDFIIFIDDQLPEIIRQPKFISKICTRRTGIGADAVMIITQVDGYDYKMDYYNSDGSWETMCANGSRCTAKVMFMEGLTDSKINFLAGDGPHQMEILENGMVKLQMTPPSYKSNHLKVNGYSGIHVDSGATHFVTNVPVLNVDMVEAAAPGIRYNDLFSPRGINVNFYHEIDSSHLEVITYEKGIEKVMLSCGSGSVASVYHASQNSNLESPVEITVPGGKLYVDFDKSWKEVWLTGPAVILFKSQLNPLDFQ
jgi:diaminopimelate epimerase